MPDVRVQTGSVVATLVRSATTPPGLSTPFSVPAAAAPYAALLPPSFGQILGDMMTTISVGRALPPTTGREPAARGTGNAETALAAPTDNCLAVPNPGRSEAKGLPAATSRPEKLDRPAAAPQVESEKPGTPRESLEPAADPIEKPMEDAMLEAVLLVTTPPPVVTPIEGAETVDTTPTANPIVPVESVLPDSATPLPSASVLPSEGLEVPTTQPVAPTDSEKAVDLDSSDSVKLSEAVLDPVRAKPMTRSDRPKEAFTEMLDAAKMPVNESPAPPAAPVKEPVVATGSPREAATVPTIAVVEVETVHSRTTGVIDSAVSAITAAHAAAVDASAPGDEAVIVNDRLGSSPAPAAPETVLSGAQAVKAPTGASLSGELSGGMSGDSHGAEPGGVRSMTSVGGRGAADSFAERLQSLGEARANQAEMIERIVRHTRMGVEAGQTRIRIQLNPPALGHLKLDLGVQDGVLNARLQTETVAAQVALQSNLDTLRDSLEQQGIFVGSFEVSVRQEGQSAGAFAFGRPSFAESLHRGSSRRTVEPELALAEAGAGASGPGWHLVDLFA